MSEPHQPLPELLGSELVCDTGVFEITRATLREPGGRPFQRLVVEHPGAVALVALDPAGHWLLVRQYRHPAQQHLLEIPAGTCEPGESPDVTAQRELREETGFAAGRLERIGGAWMAPGYTAEFIHYYLATELRADPLPPDEDEGLSEPIPFDEAELWNMIASGELEDAKTQVALTLMRARAVASPGPIGAVGT